MNVIRNLKVRKSNDVIIDAVYLQDEDGVIWYQESGGEIEEYIGHKYGCSECIHCIFNAETNNEIYQVKPLPAHTCKCELLNQKYKEFDITFKSSWNNCKHSVCDNFEPTYNYDEWNVNQFIDIQNSCVHNDLVFIQGLSYKGYQLPFTFYVTEELWNNHSFIQKDSLGYKVYITKPVIWDVFTIENHKYKGSKNYIEQNNIISDFLKEDINRAFKMNWNECQRNYSDRWFSLKTMWFI